jgi:superfamily II DNA or RNA helicase
MFKLDKHKLKRQEEGADKWKAAGGEGTLEYPTGLGKTFVAINIIMTKMSLKNPNRRYLVVVPKIELKRQWEGLIEDAKIPNCSVEVINTIIQDGAEINCDLLVLDEIHRYASDEFRKVFTLVDYKHILGLTATLQRMDGKHLYISKYCSIVDSISAEEARKNGWTSDYKEYAISVQMTPDERIAYNKVHGQFYHYFSKFGQDFDLAMSCATDKNKALTLAFNRGWDHSLGKNHPWSPQQIQYYATMFLRAMQIRKGYLYNLKSKKAVVKDIISLQPYPVKTIVFSESTFFADALTDEIPGSVAYHSNIKKAVIRGKKVSGAERKRRAIKKFKSGKSKVISTAKALDEGFDVPDIEMAIVAAYTSNPTQKIQRRGRAVRRWTFADGSEKVPKIVYLYTEGTQEEKWLKNYLKNSPNVTFVKDASEIFKQKTITLTGSRIDTPGKGGFVAHE